MSDRCYFSINVLKGDVEKVNEIVFGKCEGCKWSEEDDSFDYDCVVNLVEYEANYGYFDERKRLEKEGIVFFGVHGSGGTYGEFVFACDGDKQAECNAIESIPVAIVDFNGNVSETSLKDAQEYCKTLMFVEKLFKDMSTDAGNE